MCQQQKLTERPRKPTQADAEHSTSPFYHRFHDAFSLQRQHASSSLHCAMLPSSPLTIRDSHMLSLCRSCVRLGGGEPDALQCLHKHTSYISFLGDDTALSSATRILLPPRNYAIRYHPGVVSHCLLLKCDFTILCGLGSACRQTRLCICTRDLYRVCRSGRTKGE